MKSRIEGPLRLDKGLFDIFLSAPEDPLPGFQAASSALKGRGKDHPRYGRWIYSLVRFYRPETVVEVGTNAGGTAVGTARALAENKNGRLICVDNGEGVPRVFPEVARRNIILAGLAENRFELICADSKAAIPALASRLKGKVGVYIVDAAHTFEAALADIENGLPMVKPGGYMAWVSTKSSTSR